MALSYLASRGVDLDAELSKLHMSDPNADAWPSNTRQNAEGPPVSKILRVCLPRRSTSSVWDVSISDGCISSIEPHETSVLRIKHLPGVIDAQERLLTPALCHAHVHLDKCFLLQDPKYEDLEIVKGDFQEAMAITDQAKERYTEDDLLRRGGQLIEESIEAGVTAIRAYTEVDEIVGQKCIDVGLLLKSRFRSRCEIQLCVYAQLPVFSCEDGGVRMRSLIEEAVCKEGVDAIGSTPYVEESQEKQEQNISWVVGMALKYDKHLDIHLDYHLDKSKAMIWNALEELRRKRWRAHAKAERTIMLGHCTALSLFTNREWTELKQGIDDLPIHFVGLPTSDLFMMDRRGSREGLTVSDADDGGEPRSRGTLQIPQIIQEHDIQGAIAINNVGNAFTPHGNCDPLSIASLGVGVYQAGSKQQAEILFVCATLLNKL